MIKVLIVEDDPMVAEFNKRYLNQVQGFELVSIADSVEKALNILKEREVNLILLDIFMPGSNGLELLYKIREMNKEIDVILVTAARDIQTIKKALKHGVVDYLIKPFEFERFNSALSAYRETHKFIRYKDELSQEELDKLFINKEQEKGTRMEAAMLPKGLDKNTLKRVWAGIELTNGQAFSTEELAGNIGISRVSMRKYLEFLVQEGFLNMEIEYGSVGRPIYKYKWVQCQISPPFI